ncbi:MAG: AzlD domain-containing protein [Bradyrhizobiaceae bacterium]|nr:AzlD domain-containing protein [Bradyrhizobiaceae bacterium]
MTSEWASPAVIVAILAMAAATYPMRAGGYWLMGRIALTPRVRRMLEASPGAVIVATILPILIREGLPAALAILAAGAAMYFFRRDYLAVAAGMALAAAARAFLT